MGYGAQRLRGSGIPCEHLAAGSGQARAIDALRAREWTLTVVVVADGGCD